MENEMNPYADQDGKPLPGKIADFLEWSDQQYERYLTTLSNEEREKEVRLREKRQARIQSQISVSIV
ncbi:hypothetical protein [Salmonirosea aquatica]|uniref:Uncharacterized protein n=1 Tax=Salmonirosea aquatica TaxID=2654236 RepID=A0A7C9BF10_9BACT|nr:hypothetical protein [Cytophagaceae bacterium SJW1-29]